MPGPETSFGQLPQKGVADERQRMAAADKRGRLASEVGE